MLNAKKNLLLLCLGLMSAVPLHAKPSVFLNGVNIDGVTNQRFEKCTVRLDADGNVLITAKGYEVKTVEPDQRAPAPKSSEPPVSRKYFLVSDTNASGMTQYDIDVFVNSVWVKRIAHTDPQTILDVSAHLHRGTNLIHVAATKEVKGERKSASSQHFLKVVLGEGTEDNQNVVIENPIVEFKVDASQMQNQTKEFRVKGR